MLTAKFDKTGFNRGMKAFVDRLGIEAPVVLKKEIGELVKTLVRLTPAADGEKIAENYTHKFAMIGDDRNSDTAWVKDKGQVGSTGILWVAVSSKFLYGVAPENDKRDASVEALEQLSYRITQGGRLNMAIRGNNKQRAILYQTVLTKRATVNKLIAKKKKARGRLKAGWMASVFFGTITLSGGNMPPVMVTRHRDGVKGYFINGLGIPNNPSFTIANTAAGVGNKKNGIDSIVAAAVSIRVEAMKKNLTFFMSGKKSLSDYIK